jgi:hypothetical protein
VPGPTEKPEGLIEAFLTGCAQGAAASIDGAIPIFDPLSGFYDADAPGIAFSQTVGGTALQYLTGISGARTLAAATRGAARGTILYRMGNNPTLRVGYGPGGSLGSRIPRIAIGGTAEKAHIPLLTPTIDKVIQSGLSVARRLVCPK